MNVEKLNSTDTDNKPVSTQMEEHLQLVQQLQSADPHLTLLTGKELAIYWKVSKKKIEADRVSGAGIPFIRLSSGAIRYRLQAVLQHMADNQCTNTCNQSPRPEKTKCQNAN